MAQRVKRLPAMQETWGRSLGQEDPLEKEMQPSPVLLPGKFHGQRSLVDYSPWDRKESDMTERLHFDFLFKVSSTMLGTLVVLSEEQLQRTIILPILWESFKASVEKL